MRIVLFSTSCMKVLSGEEGRDPKKRTLLSSSSSCPSLSKNSNVSSWPRTAAQASEVYRRDPGSGFLMSVRWTRRFTWNKLLSASGWRCQYCLADGVMYSNELPLTALRSLSERLFSAICKWTGGRGSVCSRTIRIMIGPFVWMVTLLRWQAIVAIGHVVTWETPSHLQYPKPFLFNNLLDPDNANHSCR